MKKLMTMIAAVATAFGLYADVATGTGFEGSGTGGALADVVSSITELDTGATAANYWEGLTGLTAEEASVISYQGDEYTGEFPSQFDTAGDWYLNLKTGAKTLTRYYTDAKATVDVTAGNQFFDSVVKLTGFDEEPTIDADAKLAVWLSAIDADATTSPATVGETNLYVSVNGTKYDCGPRPALLDNWARLTIKAMPIGGDKIGFVVFVNQTAVSSTALDYTGMTLTDTADVYAKAKQLFPLENGTTIESIGFKGVGSVDDLVFTDVAPDFAKDTDFFTIAPGANVAKFTVDSKDYTEAAKFIVNKEALAVTITYAETYFGDTATNITGEANETYTVGNAKKIGATVTIDDVDQYFVDAAAAIDALNDGDVYTEPTTATLKLGAESGAVELNNENITLTLDLAGQTIKNEEGDAISVVAGTLTIKDSDPDKKGAVIAANLDGWSYAVNSDSANVTIEAGAFDGTIFLGGEDSSITGGKFLIEANEEGSLNDYNKDETKEFVDDENGYWKLGEAAPKTGTVIFICGEDAPITNELNVGETIVFPTVAKLYQNASWFKEATFETPADTEVQEGENTYYAKLDLAFTGSGTEGAPYEIADVSDLKKLQALVNDDVDSDVNHTEGVYFKQTDEIDMDGEIWSGIGYNHDGQSPFTTSWKNGGKAYFAGVYDGNGQTIKNITFARNDYEGFFNSLGNATIKSLTLVTKGMDPNDAAEKGGAGVLAGVVMGSTISNVTIEGELLNAKHNAAGLAIKACGDTTFVDCTNNADITCLANKRASGMVAFSSSLQGSLTFTRCVNNGNICVKYNASTSYGIGGFLGTFSPYSEGAVLTFTDCVNNGTITRSEVPAEGTVTANIGTFIGVLGKDSNYPNLTHSVVATGCSAQADMASIGVNNTNAEKATIDGLGFATFESDVATFVAPEDKGTYNVMFEGAALVLANEGDSVTLLPTFGTPVVTTSAEDCEVKVEGNVYTVVKAIVDPIPPVDPKTDDEVKEIVSKLADPAVAEIVKTPADYTAFQTWAHNVQGKTTAEIAVAAHVADSFQLGLTALLENEPKAEIKTVATTDDTTITLTFEIKDGETAVEVAAAAAAYVQTLVKCAEDVSFTTTITPEVNVTVDGTTLTATVALPEAKPAAFMKVAK